MNQKYPITDLHCDLLSYLANAPNATIHSTKDIGITLPFMNAGNVKHQVLAIFSLTKKGSVANANKQIKIFQDLIASDDFYSITTKEDAPKILTENRVGVTLAIESGSNLAEEDEHLDLAFQRFDELLEKVDHVFYIGFTHHTENRFGGGNYSDNVGLKRDGELLLEYLDGKGIAVDLAHTSDNLAYGLINYIEAKKLDIPVIASHSNYRELSNHVRNLPQELITEVIRRNGVMGMNFLRAYIHPTNPNYFYKHLRRGLNTIPNHLAWGADFFYRAGIESAYPERIPIFFEEHSDASKYPTLLKHLESDGYKEQALNQLCYGNVLRYIKEFWKN